jgi:hypothetical protein
MALSVPTRAPRTQGQRAAAPWRLTTVNKFQMAVVVAGGGLAYFYYTLRGYFVLT